MNDQDNWAKNITDVTKFLSKIFIDNYWAPLRNYVDKNPHTLKHIPGFLINPDQIIIYFTKHHLVYEFVGPLHTDVVKKIIGFMFTCHDYTGKEDELLDLIVGFKFEGTSKVKLPLVPFSEDLIIPSNKGFDLLRKLKWNFTAQDSILSINPPGYYFEKDKFTRIVNGLFFDADRNGLKTRNIKWLDCFPIQFEDLDEDYERITYNIEFFEQLVEVDKNAFYPKVEDFKYDKLQKLNRFIELIGNETSSETDITHFLTSLENQFILTMAFFAIKVYPQIKCKWQSEKKDPIIPDFFVTQPNAFSNIVEFKLPFIKAKSVVGRPNRESLSAELNSYIAQTRVYKNYFDDPNNRNWLQRKHKIKVLHPKRILVIGRRWQFENTVWKEIIADYKDLEVVTYDDLIDGVTAQLYMK